MGNVVDSLVSGFTKVLADVLAKPLDFLSGKACRYVATYLPTYLVHLLHRSVNSLPRSSVPFILLTAMQF